jgi:hypothetical protein
VRAIFALLEGEEGRVRKFILEGKKAVEQKNILSCASMIADTYQDKYGNDRQSLIFAAKNFFSYYQSVFIAIEKMEIKLSQSRDKAEVEMVALVLCRLQDNSTEHIFEKEKGRFMVKLVKEDKKWKLQEIEFLEEISVMGEKIS